MANLLKGGIPFSSGMSSRTITTIKFPDMRVVQVSCLGSLFPFSNVLLLQCVSYFLVRQSCCHSFFDSFVYLTGAAQQEPN